jgi:hypothetical protein
MACSAVGEDPTVLAVQCSLIHMPSIQAMYVQACAGQDQVVGHMNDTSALDVSDPVLSISGEHVAMSSCLPKLSSHPVTSYSLVKL